MLVSILQPRMLRIGGEEEADHTSVPGGAVGQASFLVFCLHHSPEAGHVIIISSSWMWTGCPGILCRNRCAGEHKPWRRGRHQAGSGRGSGPWPPSLATISQTLLTRQLSWGVCEPPIVLPKCFFPLKSAQYVSAACKHHSNTTALVISHSPGRIDTGASQLIPHLWKTREEPGKERAPGWISRVPALREHQAGKEKNACHVLLRQSNDRTKK